VVVATGQPIETGNQSKAGSSIRRQIV
jgi:hypothetical protein